MRGRGGEARRAPVAVVSGSEGSSPDAVDDQDLVSHRWTRIRDAVLRESSHEGLRRWLSRIQGVSLVEGALHLRVRGPRTARWLEHRFQRLLEEVSRREFGAALRVRIEVDSTVGGALVALGLAPPRRDAPVHAVPFTVTEENRLAHRALLQLARGESSDWDRVVVIGPEGVGKTHLLDAFQKARERRHPTERWTRHRGLGFFREYSAACRERAWAAFRGNVIAHDGWILDDLHELSGKLRCQEQLTQLLEYDRDNGRPVVIATRSLSLSAREFTPTLRSILSSALSLSVPELSSASKQEVLRARARSALVPDWYLQEVSTSGRSLRRCIDQCREVGRLGAALRRAPRRAEIAEKDAGLLTVADRREPMDHLLDRCAELVGAERQAVVSGSRSRAASLGRHLAIYLALEVCGLRRATVRKWLGNLSASVVPYARRKVEALREKDPKIEGFVREVSGEVLHGQRLLF